MKKTDGIIEITNIKLTLRRVLKKSSKASFTIEAAFLLSSGIMIIMSILFIGFYLCDTIEMRCTLNEVVQEGVFSDWTEQDIKNEIGLKLQGILHHSTIDEIITNKTGTNTEAKIKFKLFIPLKGLQYYLETVKKENQIMIKESNQKPAETIRRINFLDSIIN